MRLEPREQFSYPIAAFAPVIAILVAFVIGSGLILWAGHSPFSAYWELFKGAFGSANAVNETLSRSIPLILTGLCAAVAFRAKFWNIGGEGQFYCGALAATYFGTGLITLPPVLMIPFLFVMGALAGGVALIIPVFLKNRLKVDEVVTTLLLNFVILLLVGYLIEGPWKDPMSLGWPQAAPIIDEGVLPKLLARGRLHGGLIVALLMAVLIWIIMRYTVWGYEIRAVGQNDKAAEFAGIGIARTIVLTAMISGGLAGMAGVSETIGLKGYLTRDLSPGFGYTGIAVAMLANLHPLGVIPAAIFLSAVYIGADTMSRALNIPNIIAEVLVALSVLAVLVSVLFARYRLRMRGA